MAGFWNGPIDPIILSYFDVISPCGDHLPNSDGDRVGSQQMQRKAAISCRGLCENGAGKSAKMSQEREGEEERKQRGERERGRGESCSPGFGLVAAVPRWVEVLPRCLVMMNSLSLSLSETLSLSFSRDLSLSLLSPLFSLSLSLSLSPSLSRPLYFSFSHFSRHFKSAPGHLLDHTCMYPPSHRLPVFSFRLSQKPAVTTAFGLLLLRIDCRRPRPWRVSLAARLRTPP